jgi:uncharacterized phage-associated protein
MNAWMETPPDAPTIRDDVKVAVDAVCAFVQSMSLHTLVDEVHKEGPWLACSNKQAISEASMVKWYQRDPNKLIKRILSSRGDAGSRATMVNTPATSL